MSVRKLRNPATTERALVRRAALALHSPAGRLNVGDTTVAWYETAPASSLLHPILCLHDLASGSREFAPLLRQPMPGARLVLLDWPSHGRSPLAPNAAPQSLSLDSAADLLDGFLTASSLVQPTLVASGFAAAVALQYAAAHSQRLRGVVLIHPPLLDSSRPVSELEPVPARSLFRKDPKALTPPRRQALRLAAVRPAFLEMLSEISHSPGLEAERLRRLLTHLETPALLTIAPQSRSRMRAWLRLIDQTLTDAPQHRIAVFSGGFHPLWDEPERFAQTVLAFVQAQLPLRSHRHAWQLTAVDYPSRSMNLWRCVHAECDEEQILREGENPNQQPAATAD